MASLHAALLECTDDEQKKIDRLNSKMQLVRDVNALRLPTLFGPRMWKGILPIDKIDLTNDAYLMRIVRKTPCWLLYTDEETFIQELKQLFYFCAWEKKQAV